MSEKLTVWWGIPCKSAIPVFKSLAEQQDTDILFVALNDLPSHRKKLGWGVPDFGKLPFEVLGANWMSHARDLIDARAGLHIVNGIYHDERISYVSHRLAEVHREFGVVMEAPANLQTGLRRVIKNLVGPIITPIRTRSVAQKAKFVLSASGDHQRDFERLGFAKERIFRYGYFPDFPMLTRHPNSSLGLRILCIGYLEPFKGQDCLLSSLSILNKNRTPFECVITGFGSTASSLQKMSDRLGLQDKVKFEGVVSNDRLRDLFGWANILVAPGFEEPWGIRVNEALLSGLPVVVSDGVGAKELVEASGAGELFRAGSPPSLADALARSLARLSNGDELLDKVRTFQQCITPHAAAAYLAEVLDYVEVGSGSGLPRPVPAWSSLSKIGRLLPQEGAV
ncbi:glycosyltransferase family 4 protein [Mesorhizobium mediterraneum]|uniref:glycosyltransferase family 4 protein n=1 Tax=Mesorhizobium mediterraneum TaxID=43617 RepID=UPI00177C4164|nr:glycosyltransferase family 4 protein [Mesorhizobium mediterraneum]